MERLIGSLFEALGDADWASPFLTGVCAATQSHAAAVLEVEVATRRQTLPAYVGQGPAMAEAFEQTHAAGNPWRPRDERVGPAAGCVVVPDDFLPLPSLRKTAFWADFLKPMDVDHGAGVIGRRTADRVLSLTLLRSSRGGTYSSDERAWLARLAPHWVNACALRDRLVPPDPGAWDGARAFDVLGTAAFLLDERGRCTQWNAAAEELLRDGGLIRMRGERLLTACTGNRSPFLPATGPVALRTREGSVAGHAAAYPLPGHGLLGGARSVVFVEPLGTIASDRMRRSLAALYGLTPREAELASRLADGADLAEVAETMGLRPGAVRTRLKTVYGKTGTHHQGELIALARSLRTVIEPMGDGKAAQLLERPSKTPPTSCARDPNR